MLFVGSRCWCEILSQDVDLRVPGESSGCPAAACRFTARLQLHRLEPGAVIALRGGAAKGKKRIFLSGRQRRMSSRFDQLIAPKQKKVQRSKSTSSRLQITGNSARELG